MVLDKNFEKRIDEAIKRATSSGCLVVEQEPGRYIAIEDVVTAVGMKYKKTHYAENDFFIVDTKDESTKEIVDNITRIISEIGSSVYGPLSLSLVHEEIKQRTTYRVSEMQKLNEVPILCIESEPDKKNIEELLKKAMERYNKQNPN